MYKSILLPIDLSHGELVGRILKRALFLADKDTKLTFLNVVDEVPSYAQSYLPEGQMDTNVSHARQELKAICTANNIKADCVVHTGKAIPAILDEAESIGADLIIIASHKPGFQDYLIGSTAARVVRHAKCSVLVDR